MKHKTKFATLLLAVLVATNFSCNQSSPKSETTSANTGADTSNDRFPFEGGYPKPGTADKLLDEMDYQRACQAYLWALPMVGMTEWRKANDEVFKVKNGQLVSYITLDEKQGILTPNYTTPYVIGIVNLAESGPWVFDFPKGLLAGMMLDTWQRSITDLGVIGPDKGNGGKYLIIGPGQEELKPPGYFIVHSTTNYVLFGSRVINADQADELIPKFKAYSYKDAAKPPVVEVFKAGDKKWSQMPPHGMAYWERVSARINQEPVQERDRLFMAQLRFLGIEKGKPFKPDARQTRILIKAAEDGEMMAKVNCYTRRFEPPMWDGARWKDILTVNTTQHAEFFDQLDERAAYFYEAVAVSEAMRTKTPGVGQRYVACYQDKEGGYFAGGNVYRLHVPANPPVAQFWSVTVYDESTREFVVNSSKLVDISSRKNSLVKNSDGSVDVYFGPEAPKGFENNWVQTNKGEGWFPIFRFYGPTQPFFDKSWSLKDIEKVQ